MHAYCYGFSQILLTSIEDLVGLALSAPAFCEKLPRFIEFSTVLGKLSYNMSNYMFEC